MKIAMLAPVWLPVPPQKYGGIELIVYYITEGLVKRGHDVTLFASGDSQTSAHLSSIYDQALGNDARFKDSFFRPMLHINACLQRAKEFDIIHNHAQFYSLFLSQNLSTPLVNTLHGTLKEGEVTEEKRDTLKTFANQNFVSISNNQTEGLPTINYVGTVYNGIDLSEFEFSEGKRDHLLWMGRITPKKGVLEAIKAVQQTSHTLEICAAIDPTDQEFFKHEIEPTIDNDTIVFKGEIGRDQKSSTYKNAIATLFPITWEEPFGLVMTESMACGTPVIAYAKGSVPEIIEDGVTGYIVNASEEDKRGDFLIKKTGIKGLQEAIERIYALSNEEYTKMSRACRERVEKYFSVEKMIDGYEKVYQDIVSRHV